MTVKKLVNIFLEIETKYDLLNREWAGVKAWQAFRMQIYYEIAQEVGVFKKPHTEKESIWDRLKNLGTIIKSSLFYNPFLSKNNSDYICIDHKRKRKVDGQYIDIYTKYFLSELRKHEVKVEVWEKPYLNKHLTGWETNRYHLDFLGFCYHVSAWFYNYRFSREEKEVLKSIEKDISGQLDIEIEIEDRISKYISLSKFQYLFFKKLFQLKTPQKLFIVVAYGFSNVVKAAKDLGIETIELQHGVISKFHMGYHYPNNDAYLEYFPDKLLLWDDYWKLMADFPLPDSKIGIYPFKFLQKKKKNYKKVQKIEDQILVISQGVIGDRIAKKILRQIESLKDFKIIFKLHPGEADRWTTYQFLPKLKNYPNVEIVDDFNKDIYYYFAQSKYVLGVFSTAVFEALEFNCEIILLDLPGIEYMEDFLKNDKAALVTGDENITDFI